MEVQYFCRLRPLGEYFIGGEKTFDFWGSKGSAKSNYFIHSEEFLMEIALCYYYTNNLNLAKKYFKKLRLINNSLHFIDIYLKNIKLFYL